MKIVSWSSGRTRLELVQGDITRQDMETIVNAANRKLDPGGTYQERYTARPVRRCGVNAGCRSEHDLKASKNAAKEVLDQ